MLYLIILNGKYRLSRYYVNYPVMLIPGEIFCRTNINELVMTFVTALRCAAFDRIGSEFEGWGGIQVSSCIPRPRGIVGSQFLSSWVGKFRSWVKQHNCHFCPIFYIFHSSSLPFLLVFVAFSK